jgi:hypothetical protein
LAAHCSRKGNQVLCVFPCINALSQHLVVGCLFLLAPHLRRGIPDERMKPIESGGKLSSEQRPAVTAFKVCRFM